MSSNAYRFVGWYKDADCTELIKDTNWVSGNAITPQKVDNDSDPNTPVYTPATYYAKFEWNLTELTITKTGLKQNTQEDCESAIFVVTDKSNKEVATIVLQNDGSATIDGLTVGETYTITEVNAWTWRYDVKEPVEVTIAAPGEGKNTVTFVNEQKKYKWLAGDNYKTNVFTSTGSE